MTLSCLIVDDEPLARERVRRLLASAEDVTLAGEHADAESALAALRAAPPHVLFLDVGLPEIDGLEMLAALPAPPATILTTAHRGHALRAFDLAVVDYLLKPFSAARFHEALDRARERLTARAVDRIAVRDGGSVKLVAAGDIDWIEAADNYAVLHAGREEHLVREPLAALEGRLDRRFARVHRSAIVNLDRVTELAPLYAGDWELRLATGARVRLSRSYRERVHARLGVR
jgi:two-component system LytT family response regulator